jgi:hypothetical protein
MVPLYKPAESCPFEFALTVIEAGVVAPAEDTDSQLPPPEPVVAKTLKGSAAPLLAEI